MVSFSKALVLFTIILTPVYLILLTLSQRAQKRPSRLTHSKVLRGIIFGLFLVGVLTISLLHLPGFRETWTYSILVLSLAGMLLCAIRSSLASNKVRTLILASAVIYHIAFLYFPPFGIAIHERTPAIAKLSLEGHWDTGWYFLNPVYNPFPMDISLTNTFSMVTSIPYIAQLSNWTLVLTFIVAFDLVLYCLVKQVTGSSTAGIFAIFILASTPPANIILHGAKWIGSLLVLISALALIKAFDGLSPRLNIIVANVSYAMAIFFHPSAAIGAFFPLTILVVCFFMKVVSREKAWIRLFKSPLFRVAFVLFILITLVRAIYTAGYLESILPALKSFVLAMFGYIPPAEELTPVYEHAVSPINAYAWSTPVAMASALMIYCFIKKRVLGGRLTLPMYFTAASFVTIGFLTGMLRAGGFQGAMYPAFVFFIPAATVVGERILRSSKVLVALFALLMILFVGIAITDPMLSPKRYAETGAENISPKVEDYMESRFLIDIIPPERGLVAPYEIGASFSYLEIAENKPSHSYSTSSADYLRIVIDRVVHNKELLPDIVYIWPQRWHPNIRSQLADILINVYYDSHRYVVFERCQ